MNILFLLPYSSVHANREIGDSSPLIVGQQADVSLRLPTVGSYHV